MRVMSVTLQVIEGALENFIGEILLGAVLTVVFFLKENYQIKQQLTVVTQELEMSRDKTRLDRHEDRLDNVNEAVDEVKQSVERIEKHFTGNDDDPTNEGLLKETHLLQQDIREVKKILVKMEAENEDFDLDIQGEN